MRNIHRHYEMVHDRLFMTQIQYEPISPSDVDVLSMEVYPFLNGKCGACVNINSDNVNPRMKEHAIEMMKKDGLLV